MPTSSLSKQYIASEVEPRWLKSWLDSDLFHADEQAAKTPFAITLPPPNVTGSLHMGHALGSTIQDVLIRWRRMQGRNAMWMPGTDHAGIATQMLVERELKATEGKSRHDIGREAFLAKVWEWKDKHAGRIKEQMVMMGFSLDWERERFTMDEGASRAVREDFVRLYEEGLIYRAERLVNWCSDCQTAVSDLEVVNVDEQGSLWELKYQVKGDPSRFITVATTRPETLLGDTGLAVHPDDERYRDLIGQTVIVPLCDREIPVVADTFVDPEFGSGAVKVTPGHDFNDFEAGKRCGLETMNIIDRQGTMCGDIPAKYIGMSVAEARKAVVADLDALGQLGEIEAYKVPRGRCERSNTVIEPLLSEQWWVDTEPLAKRAIAAVEEGHTKFVPELWTKTYMHWMTNIKPWCISRQLWWGHRIPAWYCEDCAQPTVSRETPQACSKCGSASLRQDDDVLDTWFSSALWPFSTLGWPEETRALRTFYPNAVLVTAPDIIFFWVARMMMMGLHFMDEVPFETVYLTPVVTDENGDKMSKTKGNVIDPLHIVHGATFEELSAGAKGQPAALNFIKKNMPKGITAMGADALRFSLTAMTMAGRNIRISMERVEGYRNFINKLWNASRFSLMNLEGFDANLFAKVFASGAPSSDPDFAMDLSQRWILSRLQRVANEVDEALETFKFSEAANTLYHFVWGELCDWYIEMSKPAFRSEETRLMAQGVLVTVLETALRLLHPIIPFVTEEIWQQLPRPSEVSGSIMTTIYPIGMDAFIDEAAERDMALIQGVISSVRTLRSTYHVPPAQRVAILVRAPEAGDREVLETGRSIIESVGRLEMTLSEAGEPVPQSAKTIVGGNIEVIVPLAGLVDIDAEKARIRKDIGRAEKEVKGIEKKLGNKDFLARAPEEVVEEQQRRLEEEQQRKTLLVEALEFLA